MNNYCSYVVKHTLWKCTIVAIVPCAQHGPTCRQCILTWYHTSESASCGATMAAPAAMEVRIKLVLLCDLKLLLNNAFHAAPNSRCLRNYLCGAWSDAHPNAPNPYNIVATCNQT